MGKVNDNKRNFQRFLHANGGKLIGVAVLVTVLVVVAIVMGSQDNHKPQLDGEPTVEKSGLIEEQVLMDQEQFKVTAKELAAPTGEKGAMLRFLFENDSNETLSIPSIQMSSVNGVMIDAATDCVVEAGKKMHKDIVFDKDQMDEAGITTISDIYFTAPVFSISEDGKSQTLVYKSAPIHVKTNAEDVPQSDQVQGGTNLVDQDGFQAVLCSYSAATRTCKLLLHNNAENSVTASIASLGINQETQPAEVMSGLLNVSITGGMSRFVDVSLPDGAEVKTFGISFAISDYNTEAPLFTTAVAEVAPK